MSYYFHGTDDDTLTLNGTNPSSRQQDLCLTDDKRIARQYATRWGAGVVFEIYVSLDDEEIATEEQALALCGIDADEIVFMTPSEKFAAIDQLNASQVLAAGFKAVTYEDQMPGTPDRFEALRVYDYTALEISEMEEA